MPPTPEDIEQSLVIPDEIANPMFAAVEQQDAQRGDWPSPREHRQPDPPWPPQDSPVLRFLIHKARASIDAGMDPGPAMLQLAVHAWFEGGIEGYDRGQRDARGPRPIG